MSNDSLCVRMKKMLRELCDQKREAWITFVVAHSFVTKQVDKVLASKGLPGLEVYDVLLTLEHADEGRLRMSELADRIMLSRSGITRLVDRLERDGLLERHNCPLDRRATYAVLTDVGRETRIRIWPVYRAAIIELFGDKITDEEAETMSSAFLKVLEGVPRELLPGMPTCNSSL